MARLLRRRLEEGISAGEIVGLDFSQPTQANAVFGLLDPAKADLIRSDVRFYDWDRARGEVRWMCAFDTTEDDVNTFVQTISRVLSR